MWASRFFQKTRHSNNTWTGLNAGKYALVCHGLIALYAVTLNQLHYLPNFGVIWYRA